MINYIKITVICKYNYAICGYLLLMFDVGVPSVYYDTFNE